MIISCIQSSAQPSQNSQSTTKSSYPIESLRKKKETIFPRRLLPKIALTSPKLAIERPPNVVQQPSRGPYIYLHASRTNSVIGYQDIRRSSVGHRNGSSVHPHLTISLHPPHSPFHIISFS